MNDTVKSFVEKYEKYYQRRLRPFETSLLQNFLDYLGIVEPETNSENIRIAFISEDPGHTTGGRYYAYFIACALVELGYEVNFYTNKRAEFIDGFSKYKQPNIKIVAKTSRGLETIDVKADIYIGTPISGSIAAIRLGRKYRKKTFAMIYDPFPMMEKYLGKKYSGWQVLLPELINSDCNIISLCNTTTEYIYDWLHKRRDQVFPIYPCINSKELVPISEEEDYAVFVSRLVAHKNFEQAVIACKNLGIKLKVVAGVDGIQAERIVKRLGADVEFHFKVSDREKFALISKARVLINPTGFEGFGMWAIEAMAYGIPIVCYDFPTVREIQKYAGVDNIYFAKEGELEAKLKQAYAEKKFVTPCTLFNFDAMVKRVSEVFSNEPQIGVITIALNEQKFIGASLRSVLKHPNIKRVAVVEGAVNMYPNSTEEGLSTDKTAEEITEVMKDNGKIVYHRYGFANDKVELRNKALSYLTDCNYILVVDADEVWKKEDLDKLVEAMKLNPTGQDFRFKFNHFWKRKDLLAVGSQWDSAMFRCFRFTDKSLHWETHNTPVVNSQGERVKNIISVECQVYHYGYLKDEKDIEDKLYYYSQRDRGLKVKNTWSNWQEGKETQPTHGGGTTKKFEGEHPIEVRHII